MRARANVPEAGELARELLDARARTLALVGHLGDGQLSVPYLATINPFLWELGHIAWFQEFWTLRRGRFSERSTIEGADALYDSSRVSHATRWNLPLPSRERTLAYLGQVLERVLERLDSPAAQSRYFHELALFHEDLHGEALTYTLQTLGLPEPPGFRAALPAGGPCSGDVELDGGAFVLGAEPGAGFVFDNEVPACPTGIAPFRIARGTVTQREFAAFVDDSGYARRELWTEPGWLWRERSRAQHPVYWRPAGGAWEVRRFDVWEPLAPHRPVIHVNAFEAEAYCRWSDRRLPSEAEWEFAAASSPSGKRRYPWGEGPCTRERAHLDGNSLACCDVGAHPEGDSACGLRQMLGNVWEWTASSFEPYPGFEPGPYREYSEPWFGTHRVLRGGCFATRARLIRNTWRNFFTPDRRDVFAGFRTAARSQEERP
jgi:ergothioneine biosynthesis protein EgtB